jgi:hypothetical protein
VNKLEQRNSTERGDTPQSWHAPHECSAYKSRADYRVRSFLYQPHHVDYLSRIMRVVAIHDYQYVLIACHLDYIPHQST